MIDDNIAQNEKTLAHALRIVEGRITALVARLQDDGNGRFLSDSISIQQAINIRTDIAAEMVRYNDAAMSVGQSLMGAAQLARDEVASLGIDIAFTDTDAELIKALTDDTTIGLLAAGDSAAAGLSTAVYSSVATGGDKAEVLAIVKQLISGGTDVRGRPLLNYASTIAETAYMETHATATLSLGEQAGVKRWKFSGTLVGDSRQWCADHLHKIYTMEEIKDWNKSEWAGKKQGDPFITRGGWNCRHRWVGIDPN